MLFLLLTRLLCWGPPLGTCPSQPSLAPTGVRRAVAPGARVLLTGSSAGASLWTQGCTGHHVHAELERVVLPCRVLSGLAPGTAPLLAGWLAARSRFPLCLIAAGDTPLLFTVCTDLFTNSCGNTLLALPLLLSQHPGPKPGSTAFLVA